MTKEKVRLLVKETFELQQQEKELKSKIKDNKIKIQNYFDSQETTNEQIKTLNVDGVRATMIESAYINYNGLKLEKKLKKNKKRALVDKLIKKDYKIFDIKAFMDLMKLTNLSPHEVKSHVVIDRKVDNNEVKKAFEKGEIIPKDLEGCMTTKLVKSIRFNKV